MILYAIIDGNNAAVNFVESDGPLGYIPPGCTAVEIPAGASYGYGWIWNGTNFVNPEPPPSE